MQEFTIILKMRLDHDTPVECSDVIPTVLDMIEDWDRGTLTIESVEKDIEPDSTKRYLSPVQIYCLVGRCQDYCKKYGLNFDEYKDRLVKMVQAHHDEGEPDLDKILGELLGYLASNRPR